MDILIPYLKGWIFIPDLPEHRAAWYLTAEEKEHAVNRLGTPRKQSWDLSVFRRVLLSWQFWLLPFLFMCMLTRSSKPPPSYTQD